MFKMLKTIIKNLFSKPSTRRYPYVKREPFEGARGHINNDIDQCIFCANCSRQCPAKAIHVSKEEGFWSIDRFKCIMCGYCAEKCPKKCLTIECKYADSAYQKGIHKITKESLS